MANFLKKLAVLPLPLLVGMVMVGSPSAQAQIRVVSYNTLGNPNSAGDVADWNVVLDAIGDQVVNGIAKRIGIMALQEVDESTDGANAQNIANQLNGLYGLSSYQASIAPYGEGFNLQAFVYDSSQVELMSTFIFDIGTRPAWRGRFRPIGYTDPAAEFYVYSVHFKAFSGAGNESTRANEAAILRSNGNNLGQGKNIIYAGDFNLTGGAAEQAYANMLSPGNGHAIDPQNGDFSDPLKKTWSSDGPVSRLDFQFITDELNDGEGLDLIGGSYRVFGRVQETPTRIVTLPVELIDASDHLPVVADYQVPAIMSAIASSVPATFNLGDVFSLELTVSNAANVVAAIGADELDYSITTTFNGAALNFSSFSQSDLALGGGNLYQIPLDTSSPGEKTDLISIQSGSQGVMNQMIQIPISYTVLAAGLAGDFNDDGMVDAVDYAVWRNHLGELDETNLNHNGDGGDVSLADYDLWKQQYGEVAPGSGHGGLAAVPEPASFILGCLAACCLAVRRVGTLGSWNRAL